MIDLEFVGTDELLEEVASRFHHVVFAGVKEITGGHDAVHMRWQGSLINCAGLCTMASSKIAEQYAASGFEADDEGLQ